MPTDASLRTAQLRDVHEHLAEGKELVGLKRLREEVGRVVSGADQRDNELAGLDRVADVEVAACDVLGARVELRVVGEIAGALVVRRDGRRRGDRPALDASDELAEVDEILGAFGEGDDLGLTRRQRDRILLAGAPAEDGSQPVGR